MDADKPSAALPQPKQMEQEITEVTEKESNEFIGLLCPANHRFLCELLLENLRIVQRFKPLVAQMKRAMICVHLRLSVVCYIAVFSRAIAVQCRSAAGMTNGFRCETTADS